MVPMETRRRLSAKTFRPFDALHPPSLSPSPSVSLVALPSVAPFDPAYQPPWPPFPSNTH